MPILGAKNAPKMGHPERRCGEKELLRLQLLEAGAVAAVPEEAADEVGGGAAAALDLAGLDVDVEGGDEAGDALVGEAALAEDFDLAGEQGGDLGAGVAVGVCAGGLAEFAGGDGDLIDGVGFLAGHGVPPLKL